MHAFPSSVRVTDSPYSSTPEDPRKDAGHAVI
jgi:hypothetical protein